MNTTINFEASKLLKEKGFDKPTQKAYIGNDNLFVNFEQSYGESEFFFDADDFYENWNKKGWVFNRNGEGCFGCKLDNIKYFEAYAAPTIADVIMWLYEKHGLFIHLSYVCWSHLNKDAFAPHIAKVLSDNGQSDAIRIMLANCDSPTKAYEVAIEHTLKNLI